jgi:Bacterial Ig-like domain (group 3)
VRRYLPRSAAGVAAVAAAAVLVTAGIAAPAGAGVAPATGHASAALTPNPSPTSNLLAGVSVVSGSNAWAVGSYNDATTGASKTLVLHWNGTAWSKVKSPSPSSLFSELDGVSARSGSDAWAVGRYWNVTASVWDSLVLHWNGTAWSKVKSPNPGLSFSQLYGVSAVSGSDAWAVGSYDTSDGGVTKTLVLHWDGTAWSRVNSPSPGSGLNGLTGVSAVSGGDAWAVGSSSSYDNPYVIGTLILHWNGTAWTKVSSPSPSSVSYNYLEGVSARSGSDAWAVGDYGDCATALFKRATLVAHWNGTAWINASAITTSTSVTSSANPVTTGTPVTYTATVTPTPTPDGGTVAFYDNGSLISSCTAKAVSSGRATCTVTYAAAGSHTIKATYSGYADYARSTSPSLTETVKA